jgi:F-type H+-transporting ATPase subunit a
LKRIRIYCATLALSILGAWSVAAQEAHKEQPGNDSLQHGTNHKFDPVSFIFDHIGDSYEWHIVTVNHHHISIPLPVILYSKFSGLHIFPSSRFHNPDRMYKGFKWEEEGELKGKIVEYVSGDGEHYSQVLPLNFSITKNVASIIISSVLLCWVFIGIARKYKTAPQSAPSGLQNLFEPIIIFVKDEIAIPSIGQKKYMHFMPFLLTIFFFIWFNNMLGLIPFFPGGANVTGNIAVTMVLALFTFAVTTINGNKNYWKEIFNAPGIPWFLKFPIPLMPIVELAGMFTKPFVLMIRLFANILAGHMIAIVFFSLIFIFGAINMWFGYSISVVTIVFTVFMSMLELLVALIQAYVFTLLSAIYFGMATTEHH